MENKKTRYALNIDFYIYAENDDDARKLSEKICSEQRTKFDNHCRAIQLHKTPFASLDIEQVKLDNY